MSSQKEERVFSISHLPLWLTCSAPSTFTPIHPFDMEDPRSWGATIEGMMHWDNDKIVFSKRSLLEFLKSCQLTVNTNFGEISKLPKYATFGKFDQAATDAAVADLVEAEIADPTHDSPIPGNKATVPRPSRKVVDPPGGKQSIRIYGEEYEETDALSLAPPREGNGVDVEIERLERVKLHVEPEIDGGAKIEDEPWTDIRRDKPISNPPPGFKPSRKVREAPGGKSSMGEACKSCPLSLCMDGKLMKSVRRIRKRNGSGSSSS
ncbi:hypothetical protein TREMEDRAFT_29748 [Tremella mesenterica DSM 1558]|uniref:uncharacterized protein n=1 Tax=Tremella mesenterica (strain ATCC 24925 / CBS 8224 / DSM 1558 / NBRC 9311 / NRRL Y-6157 / RJB 2259-6 / UBC 559-6) TaxID=578456 RepID=UPI0003F4955D|nr:uncharacterized protein TREMEDRAFT_29748 [Tremella mesenterica DSM 1558]EIW70061.1 hypothetical protein TREMEDRAFT_29748 [Tremella mesenterica DSM 1558]